MFVHRNPVVKMREQSGCLTVMTSEGRLTYISKSLVEQLPLLKDMTEMINQSEETVPLTVISYQSLENILFVLQAVDTMAAAKSIPEAQLVEAANAANFLQSSTLTDVFCMCLLDILDKLPIEALQNHVLFEQNEEI